MSGLLQAHSGQHSKWPISSRSEGSCLGSGSIRCHCSSTSPSLPFFHHYRISEYNSFQYAHATSRKQPRLLFSFCLQDNGLVPIVEPEILLDGEHGIDRTFEVAQKVWAEVFFYLAENNVMFEGILLKPSMVTPGAECKERATPEQVAEYTLKLLHRRVPSAVPGIMVRSTTMIILLTSLIEVMIDAAHSPVNVLANSSSLVDSRKWRQP